MGWETFNRICIVLGGLAALLFCEEWSRRKLSKGATKAMTSATGTPPRGKGLETLAAFMMLVAVVGFMISGGFWLSSLEERMSETQNRLDNSLKDLDKRTVILENKLAKLSASRPAAASTNAANRKSP
jgi:hypothetical protein